ncbi:hypothetical protein GGR50DRAFT_697625 [Xylaria sp. CBS 124048]|nr:hypothetical protein GGR50DRAFT_697625 [Xylaria sp. CBS 124048]
MEQKTSTMKVMYATVCFLFENLTNSLVDSFMIMGVTICFMPYLILSWFGWIPFLIACTFSLVMIIVDSMPRLHFFAIDNLSEAFMPHLILTVGTAWLETMCLVLFALHGSPACERSLAACFMLSTLARTLHRNAGGAPVCWERKIERVMSKIAL